MANNKMMRVSTAPLERARDSLLPTLPKMRFGEGMSLTAMSDRQLVDAGLELASSWTG